MVSMTSSVETDEARPNRMDARFGKVEIKIHSALHEMLKMRRVDVQMGEFCQMAKISRPTLHAHCTKIDDALRQYERNLEEKITQRLLLVQDDELIFLIMLGMIGREQAYFAATVPNHDYWLLNTIFEHLRGRLTNEAVDNLDYDLYVHRQIAIISCWAKFDACANERIPFYATKLKEVKVTRYWAARYSSL